MPALAPTLPTPIRTLLSALRAFARQLRLLPERFGHHHGVVARVTRAAGPAVLLELYGFEVCPATRRVRRALGRLDLDYVFRNAPVGATRTRAEVARRGGKTQFPYLVDPNTGIAMYDSREIVAYLERSYG